MKRLIYAIAVLLGIVVVSCENEPKNPGDFSKTCTLEITGPVVSLRTGKSYPMTVARETDTVYKYLYVLKDTVFDENGKPVIGSDGKIVANDDSVYVYSKIKARLVEMAPVYLPCQPDTFKLDIESNARWRADQPAVKGSETQWYINYNSTTAGGGSSNLQFRVTRNRGYTMPNVIMQQIITSDSSIMYRIPFYQYGQKDMPEDY